MNIFVESLRLLGRVAPAVVAAGAGRPSASRSASAPASRFDGSTGQDAHAFTLFPELVTVSDDAAGATDLGGAGPRCTLRHGIDAAIVYPQRAMAIGHRRDHDLRDACFDAYNTWLAEQCRLSGGRLVGVLDPGHGAPPRERTGPDAVACLTRAGGSTR